MPTTTTTTPNMNTNTMETLTAENQTFYDRTLLERLLPELQYAEDADTKVIPAGKGNTVEFRRYESLAIPTAPLTEGVTPDGKSLSITTINATAKQYGDYVTVSDVLDMQGKDPTITETSELEGEQAALLIDTIVRDEILAGTNVQYAGGKASRANITATDVITGTELRKAFRRLKKSGVKPFADGFYRVILDADQEFDFKEDKSSNGFTEIAKYANPMKLLKGEIGTFDKGRIKVSTNADTVEVGDTTKVTVHKAVVYGRHAYAMVNVQKGKGKPRIIVKRASASGTNDPLEQRNTIGWKNFFTAKRLNELSILRIESGASA